MRIEPGLGIGAGFGGDFDSKTGSRLTLASLFRYTSHTFDAKEGVVKCDIGVALSLGAQSVEM